MSKISDLSTLTVNDLTNDDVLPILDVSAGTTKKVTVGSIRAFATSEVTDITSQVTSVYTVQNATLRKITNKFGIVHVALNGGSTGIKYGTVNHIGLPNTIESITGIISVTARTEQAPTTAYLMKIPHCFKINGVRSITGSVPANIDVGSLHNLQSWFVTNAGFKALEFDMFVFLA